MVFYYFSLSTRTDRHMELPYHRMLVEEVLRPLRNKEAYFFPNSGNAGDALINVAAIHSLERAGVRYKSVGHQANVEGKTVILGGGGNLIPDYATIRNALKNFYINAKQIILLPHTIRGNEDLLEALGSNVTLICRDVESYGHASSVCRHAQVLLGHDMAFHLDEDRLMKSPETEAVYRPAFKATLEKHRIHLEELCARKKVYFARIDGERAGPIGGNDIDISAIFALGTWPGQGAETSAWGFLEAIRNAPYIVSDRLHVGIGAALLGKSCTLFDNSYGKNKGVWQNSIRYYFPHVTMPKK